MKPTTIPHEFEFMLKTPEYIQTTTSVRKPPRMTASVRTPIRPAQSNSIANEAGRIEFHMNNTCDQTDRSVTELTNDQFGGLLEDLQNPTLGSLELCQLHSLTLPELAAILESETYKQAAECIARIATARDKLQEPESKSLAKAASPASSRPTPKPTNNAKPNAKPGANSSPAPQYHTQRHPQQHPQRQPKHAHHITTHAESSQSQVLLLPNPLNRVHCPP